MAEGAKINGKIDGSPVPKHLLRGMANANLGWKTALGELIDNTCDAQAKHVIITIEEGRGKKPASVQIQDDGNGSKNLTAFVCLGKHDPQPKSRISRWGIGAKEAMLWLGHVNAKGDVDTTTTIESTQDGVTQRFQCAWDLFAEQNWLIDEEWIEERKADAGSRGTTITIRPCRKKLPQDLQALLADLGYFYSWYIKHGTRIEFRIGRNAPVLLQRWRLPKLTEVVDTHIEVGGCSARVYAGIVKDGEDNPRPGLTYFFAGRVIIENCVLGCGDSHSGVCGVVELDDRWTPTKNKDNIANRTKLGEAVYEVLKEMLAKAKARGHAIQFAAFDARVDELLNSALALVDTKGLRPNRGRRCGSRMPTGTGGKHKQGAKEGPGERFPRKARLLHVSYEHLGPTAGIGSSSEHSIVMNLSHGHIAHLRRTSNVLGVLNMAMVVYLGASYTSEGQRNMHVNLTGDLVRDIGSLLDKIARVDGVAVHEPVFDAAE